MQNQQESIVFGIEETERIFKRFIRIDADRSGGLDTEEFLSLEKMSENPIASRFIQLFDTDRNGVIDFHEFLGGLSIFGRYGNVTEKVKFIFKLYDMNSDGFISNGDLFQSLKMMVGENLTDLQLQQVVDKTIREADQDGDGRLSFLEFEVFVKEKNRDILDNITIEDSI